MVTREQIDWATDIWHTCSEALQDMFMYQPDMSPEKALGRKEWVALLDSSKWRRDDKESLILLKGNIIRECFKTNLPLEGFCPECADDLAMEFARQLIGRNEREVWLRYWADEESAGARRTTRFYKPSSMFPAIDEAGGQGSFASIVRELLTVGKSGVTLGFDEYVLFLRKRLRRISSHLDRTELRIAAHLLAHGSSDNRSLAESLEMSPEWVSRKIAELQKRKVLRRFDRIPFSRIGIRMFNLFVDARVSEENPFKFMEECPFLYSYQPVLTGKWDALSVLCVPDNITSIKLIGELEGLLNRWGFDTSLREIASSGTVDCFDHYDFRERGWSIPWELLELHLRRIHKDKLADVIDRIDAPTRRARLHLDNLDMKIIDQIRRGNGSISSVRRALRIGQTKAASRIRRIREEGLVETSWEIHNVGLNESVVVTASQGEIGEAIAAWSLRLPRAIVSFDVNRNLTMVCQLPQGGSYGVARCTGYLSHAVDVGILDERIYGGWGLPIGLWDSSRQGWRCPRNEIEKWLDGLR